ncbi:MAG: mannose-1-phosphate guanylyltransferase [Candidatus Omnitrophota bacterium]|nr:mannose-1-phosphate guanylyltransferase [Candidatus Omnitrophota bacterium]
MKKPSRFNHHLYAVVLIGGSGTRFWPLSRCAHPKQFLKLTSSLTLFEETLKRLKGVVRPSHIYIVTNVKHERKIKQLAAGFHVSSSNVLLEPSGKNTAPAAIWAALRIAAVDPHATMVILPSDHLIKHSTNFVKALGNAVDLAGRDYLVTFGIPPTRPETGYGYVKTAVRKDQGTKFFKVVRFIEKPVLAKAKKFCREKNYLWNSGMFVWKATTFLIEAQMYLPRVYGPLTRHARGPGFRQMWAKLPSISVDCGILEKAHNVAAVDAQNIGWSDVGSWQALAEVLSNDSLGNHCRGDVVTLNCAKTFVWGDHKLIAAIGLKDTVIIDTPDALLVCAKEQSQQVRRIVAHLTRSQRREV